MNKKELIGLIVRYLLLMVLALPGFYLFYIIFTPLTVKPVFWALHWAYNAVFLQGNIIFFKGYYAEIIGACVGGGAYYLLLILNLTTPMKPIKRICNLLFIFVSFLVLNIIRILVFAVLLKVGYQYFDLTHELTWYFGSTILVVLIWFAGILLFRIKSIPVYTDIHNILNDIFPEHKKKTAVSNKQKK